MVGTTTLTNNNSLNPGQYISHLPDYVLSLPAVSSGNAWAGKQIGIALIQTSTGTTSGGGYWDIDNVRLVASSPADSWTGAAGNANWSNTGNWGGMAPTSGASLSFSNTGSGTVNSTNDLAAGTSFTGINFAAGSASFNLQGNAIQIAGPIVNQSYLDQTISLDMQVATGGGTLDTGSGSLTVAGNVSGTALTKLGDGALVLSGNNSYTGGTTVLDGTLDVTTVNGLLSGSSLTVGDDTQFVSESNSSIEAATQASMPNAVPEPGTLALFVVGAAAAIGSVVSRRGRSLWSAVACHRFS